MIELFLGSYAVGFVLVSASMTFFTVVIGRKLLMRMSNNVILPNNYLHRALFFIELGEFNDNPNKLVSDSGLFNGELVHYNYKREGYYTIDNSGNNSIYKRINVN